MRATVLAMVTAAAIGFSGAVVPPSAHAALPGAIASFEVHYVAGSAHLAVDEVEEAAGGVDCGGVAGPVTSLLGADAFGGGCFDLTSFVGADFVLRATDDVSQNAVSLFGGFDDDGDGCVGCTEADHAYEGEGIVGGTISGPSFDAFVRFVSINDDGSLSTATTGTLSLDVFPPGSPANPCHSRNEKPCGHGFGDELPYPYACIPDCSTHP